MPWNLCEHVENNKMCAKYTDLDYHYCNEHYLKKMASGNKWYSCFYNAWYNLRYRSIIYARG